MSQKKVFQSIFLALTFLLMLMPFVLAFNDVLTKFVEKLVLYKVLQDTVVPLEIQVIGLVVSPFGVDFTPLRDEMMVNGMRIKMIWNCVGWQSLVLFFGSLVVGFWGSRYTLKTTIEALILGFFGLFWINIFRMAATILFAAYSVPVFQAIYHNYLAAFVTILYLFFFWWFSYSYVLEDKNREVGAQKIKE